ncbi:MAG TPA: ATP-binding protein [Thermoanaerobaculia bacterium]|nr:ATP-binding protein [Thermoanaerobaculia bacterium]
MVPEAPASLTKIGFRRDVRLFLGTLVGFLVLLIALLLTLLQSMTTRTQGAVWREWSNVADLASADLADAVTLDTLSLRTRLEFLRTRYHIAGIELTERSGRRLAVGVMTRQEMRRNTAAGQIRFAFDSPELENVESLFRRTAIITVAATVAGIILLLLYLPKITRPIETMLEDARQLGEPSADVDEERYLLETFKRSITRLQEQEAELRTLHDREKIRADDLQHVTDTLTRGLSSGFIAIDAEGKIVDVNNAARQILRLDADSSYSGLTVLEALGDRTFTRALQRAHSERLALNRAEVTEKVDPRQVIGLTTVPLSRETSEFLGLLVIFTDLTPIRALEDRVRQMQTLADLGEMSAGIAHEFRNSLSTILGYLRLASKPEAADDVSSRLRKAESEANALAAAVDRLLNLARPVAMERQRVDVLQLVRDVAQRVVGVEPGIELTVSGDEIDIVGDAALLQRAVENVIRNAVEAIRGRGGEGTIEVKTTNGENPSIAVRDDGVGMSPDDQARAFVPFHSTKGEGFGLGLPLVRKIILLHGGDVSLTSAPGEGTTVTMSLASKAADAWPEAGVGQE